MSTTTDAGRAKLLRLLMMGLAAAAALMLAVGGMVAYSAHVVDRVQVQTETRLVSRRIDRTLAQLRENVISATIWNDADLHTRAADQAWMQLNYGDYYADYMQHDVTIALAGDGHVIYASRNSEGVAPVTEAAFAGAVAPLTAEVRRLAAARPRGPGGHRVPGLAGAATREGIVLVRGQPYFVSVSNVVPDDVAHITSDTPDTLVASGMRAAALIPHLATDLGLANPKLSLGGEAPDQPAVALKNTQGHVLGWISWTPSRPGARLLMFSAAPLFALLAIAVAGLILVRRMASRLVGELAQNEQALDRSLRDARAANAAKSKFLANMSHELRTPLNGVVAMTELLYERQTDKHSREMAQTVLASSRMLERVVNDVLDVSKIEAGQMTFEVAPFDLGTLLAQIVDLHGATAAAKRVRLELHISPAAAGVYEGDATRVGQIIGNLVGNAVKFTDAGVVRVFARHGTQTLRIAVADSGIGFERDTANRLFERYEQADATTSRRYGGTGLGLSICLSLTRMMGGRLSVRSSPGKGSLFVACLPLPRLGEPMTEAAAEADHQMTLSHPGLRVLVADDHAVNRRIVAMVLEPLSMDLTLVENGVEALEAAATGLFDLVLMDVQMPVMDGLTATRKLREIEHAAGRRATPVIALTANARPEDVIRSLDAGADLHMAKPIRPSALIDAISQLLAGSDETRVAIGKAS